MNRRTCLKTLAAAGLLGPSKLLASVTNAIPGAESVENLPKIKGTITLYLGRGEGGLYEDILEAIEKRNPDLKLKIRRGPSSALANTIVAESGAGLKRADVFWAIDSGSIGRVVHDANAEPLPSNIRTLLKPEFQRESWAPISGRIRTLPYNTNRVTPEDLPKSILDLPDSGLKIGWAPAYAAFQSFVTALLLTEGEKTTRDWLRAMRSKARSFAGELNVVMAVASGDLDIGLANHYYSLRLKKGRPDAPLALGFTHNDAGCLLNASGVVLMKSRPETHLFLRYLLTKEVQSYLSREAYEIPLVAGLEPPKGLPPISEIKPPKVDLDKLANMKPTLALLRDTGIL
ncbi:extracellular solute-binding protein [Puniceicoccaceae bacterium K14]|nr:extracellular solute-binding protein [Puniceicoccaceae bacterium K14]